MGRAGLAGALALVWAGCASGPQPRPESATGGSGQEGATQRKYVDTELGFEVARPSGNWELSASGDRTADGIAMPVVLRNADSGAQVVIQVAPAVASPVQFAERLVNGLRQRPGFVTTEPRPIALCEGAVGFDFEVGEDVRGRVAVRDGGPGQVLFMMATWPTQAGAATSIEEIFISVRPVPKT